MANITTRIERLERLIEAGGQGPESMDIIWQMVKATPSRPAYDPTWVRFRACGRSTAIQYIDRQPGEPIIEFEQRALAHFSDLYGRRWIVCGSGPKG